LEDLKKGEIGNKIDIETTDAGGRNAGWLRNGNVYMLGLTALIPGSTFRVYHWNTANPVSLATRLQDFSTTGPDGPPADATPPTGAFSRYDMFNVELDDNGNGFIFAKANTGPGFMRLRVNNYTNVSDLQYYATQTHAGTWATFTMIEGSQDEFLYSGHQGPVRLISPTGNTLYTMTAFANNAGVCPRIFYFNGERYLATMTAPTGGMHVYNITRGESIQQALEIFDGLEAPSRRDLLAFNLSGPLEGLNVSLQMSVVKDEANDKVYIIGSAPTTGFAIFEIPAATDHDDFLDFVED
jgi:hypothetical protein